MVPEAVITKLSFMATEVAVRSISIFLVSPLYKEVSYITEIQPKLYWIQMTHGPGVIPAVMFTLLYYIFGPPCPKQLILDS